MSILDQYNPTQPKGNFPTERVALLAGRYGSHKKNKDGTWLEPNKAIRESLLEIVNCNKSRVEKDEETVQHSWLVTSTNGVPGTAFLNIRVHPSWQTPEAFSVVFNKGEAIEGTNGAMIRLWVTELTDRVTKLVDEANTPDEQRKEAISTRFDKALTTIHINLGQLFDLQRSKGLGRDWEVDGEALVGGTFAGTVEPGLSADTANVKSMYIPKRKVS
jgi:hypothetical protein